MAKLKVGEDQYKGRQNFIPDYVKYLVDKWGAAIEEELDGHVADYEAHVAGTADRHKAVDVTFSGAQSNVQDAVDSKADKTALAAHEADNQNPHGVTKAQVGLGNVDNTADMDKPVSAAVQEALGQKADKANSMGGFDGGSHAAATTGGAIGADSNTSGGGAVGDGARATDGGAVGMGAQTSQGFAGGYNAKTINSDTRIDAIQLGTGINPNPKTLQVYDYQLMDANGNIPAGRMQEKPGKKLGGQVVKPSSSGSVTAGEGAEIFNDYRERGYDASGNVTAGNVASGQFSTARGYMTTAAASSAVADGYKTKATGANSRAGGSETVAAGRQSTAEGSGTASRGENAHAAGKGTNANGDESFVVGRYGTAGDGVLFGVANGTDAAHPNLAFEVREDGSVRVDGESVKDIGVKDLGTITKEDVDEIYQTGIYKYYIENEQGYKSQYVLLVSYSGDPQADDEWGTIGQFRLENSGNCSHRFGTVGYNGDGWAPGPPTYDQWYTYTSREELPGIVNDLDTGSSVNPLSAAMGKKLNEEKADKVSADGGFCAGVNSYQLMDADGNIPQERILQAVEAILSAKGLI